MAFDKSKNKYPKPGQAVRSPSTDRPKSRGGGGVNPLDFLSDVPGSADLFAQAMQMASGQFNAQLGNLDKMGDQARNRAGKNDAHLAAMYKALEREIRGQSGGISKMWDTGKANVRNNTTQANNAISGIYRDSRNELGDLFSRLGIQDAAPDALRGSEKDRNLMMGMNQYRQNNALTAMDTDKAAGLNFNTAQGNIAAASGKNKRAELAQTLSDHLNGIDMKRNEVLGARESAIFQTQNQLEQQAANHQMQLLKAMQGSQSDGLSPSQQYSQLGPDERGAYKAQQMFGDQQAPYVMELLQGVARNQNGGDYTSGAHFIRSILAEQAKQEASGKPNIDDAMLQALASYYWDQGAVDKEPQPRPRYG